MDTPEASLFRKRAAEVAEQLARYIDQGYQGLGPAVSNRPMSDVRGSLQAGRLLRDGFASDQQFSEFVSAVLSDTTHLHHPGYMGHQVGSVETATAFGDFIHGVINNPGSIYEMGPSATVLETVVLEWMMEKIAWCRSKSAGVLTHGGSLANLTALLAARGRIAPKAWTEGTPGDLVVIAPASTHYSVARAVSIIGLGSNQVWAASVDQEQRLLSESVESLIERAKDEGKRVMAVVVNACATTTGLFDPIAQVATLCEKHGTWLHVDGCHGASFLVSEQTRHLLDGIDRADSVVWDAHKMMRTSALAAAVLFKDAESFNHAFQQEASYLFYDHERNGVDYLGRAVECTKSPMGLKTFLALAAGGETNLARYLDSRVALASQAHQAISQRPGFECPYQPESNILCFRAPGSDADQVAIRDALLRDGRFHITSAEIHGRRYLRLTFMSASTTPDTVESLLDWIEQWLIGR
ncbi:MAG: pyridoxal-dependent decarboxylase [Lysobacteraceae bacterium]|nr:MAG: pyridoxal-dependent decarboxylase [Xanthomonadaceae bacterium]